MVLDACACDRGHVGIRSYTFAKTGARTLQVTSFCKVCDLEWDDTYRLARRSKSRPMARSVEGPGEDFY